MIINVNRAYNHLPKVYSKYSTQRILIIIPLKADYPTFFKFSYEGLSHPFLVSLTESSYIIYNLSSFVELTPAPLPHSTLLT